MTALPRIIFGSMRMHEHGRSEDDWADFLALLHRSGIKAAHSSMEYESFGIFCKAVQRARRIHSVEMRHVVKLANPHFGEEDFDPHRLVGQVDEYRERLEVDRIDCIQWMWRVDAGKDSERMTKFAAASNYLASAMTSLKQAGKIRSVGCFPYTPEFADAVLDERWLDYLIVYRNSFERDYDRHLRTAYAKGKQVVALRPFAAGRVFAEQTATESLDYCFSHPAVCSAVATFSTSEHLADVTRAIGS